LGKTLENILGPIANLIEIITKFLKEEFGE
jgi:hypothetical protein